jgi:hypothetical protein
MVSVAALGVRPRLAGLPEGVTAAVGVLMMGAGGILIGTSIGMNPDYVADVLPGWMVIGAGVGLSLPSITSAGATNLAAHQTATGSAVLQMGRWVGSTIGVALLVVVLGTSTATGASVDSYGHAWWWAALPALLGAVLALGITPPARPGLAAGAAATH